MHQPCALNPNALAGVLPLSQHTLSPAARTVALYPWIRFCQGLLFWQAVWFLFFQNELSAAEAILLYAINDFATTALEVPSGYMSDRLGRRKTLIAAACLGVLATGLLAIGTSFAAFALAQVLLGASRACVSGTDSALLYESLAEAGREEELEAHELRAWRFSFAALTIAATTGGALSLIDMRLPFAAGILVFVAQLILCLRCAEARHVPQISPDTTKASTIHSVTTALQNPVIAWLFALSVLMYIFSHLPFVFGQPFILSALSDIGLTPQAPLISGGVTSTMMVISLCVSFFAYRLRRSLGLAPMLLLAFSMQVGLTASLALSNAVPVIALLFLRMVPDGLSRPFILARIQPLLPSDSRATFLSLQSFCARILLGGTLLVAAVNTSQVGAMPYSDIQAILAWYGALGLAAVAILALAAGRITIEPPK